MGSAYPFKKVALDTGYITLPSGQKEYFIVAVDFFTKWIEVKTVTHETELQVAQFIEEDVIMRHRCPEMILLDQGPLYNNQVVWDICAKRNIHLVFAARYHPESNNWLNAPLGP